MQPTSFPHWATWQHLSGVVRGGMAATTRPWTPWQGWVSAHADATDTNSRRRMRLSLHDIADLRDIKVDWSRMPRPEITFYTPNQIRHLIRFDGSLSRPLPSASSGWMPAQARDPATHWRLADFTHIQLPPDESPPAPAPAPPPHAHAHAHAQAHAWLESAARGLPLGAIVLVLLMLLVRVADKCLDTSFFRRRRSARRPAANATTTTSPDANAATPANIPRNELEPLDAVSSCPASAPDLPPPYTECARTVNLLRKSEDPPPPYNSACYVSFSNPKAGMPSVHFYSNLFSENNRPSSSNPTRDLHIYGFNLDTGQTPSSDDSSVGCERGLVFQNGRIVEGARQGVNDENANGANSGDSNANNDNDDSNPSYRGVFIA